MSAMLFYQNIVPLNDKVHGDLRVQSLRSYRFAATSNSVPVLAGEFAECARRYPIVFARSDAGTVPAVMLGLRDGENLFVDAAGRWAVNYIPAFVRRYPFVLGAGEGGQMVVCIDDKATCLSKTEGTPLFANGEPSATLKQSMAFLGEFQSAAAATATLAARIDELGLLRDADSLAQLKNGQQFRLRGMRVVDEPRLAALDDATALELFRSGAMRLIHIHLMSLGNLGSLMDRLGVRDGPPGKSGLKSRAPASV